ASRSTRAPTTRRSRPGARRKRSRPTWPHGSRASPPAGAPAPEPHASRAIDSRVMRSADRLLIYAAVLLRATATAFCGVILALWCKAEGLSDPQTGLVL